MRVNSLRTLEDRVADDKGPLVGQGEYDRVSVAAPFPNPRRGVSQGR